MNSGCAVVANRAIGSVPYLLKHEENGLIYETEEELYLTTKRLLDDDALRHRLGREAYVTMSETWSPENAAARLLQLIDEINANQACSLFAEGPCSAEE